MGFKVYNSRKLTAKQQKESLRVIKDFHSEKLKLENVNNSIRYENKKILRSIKDIKGDVMIKNKRQKVADLRSKITKELPVPSNASLIRTLKEKKLGYSESNMYYDINRNAAFYKSKTIEKSQKAQNWFDNYFEPFRKKNGMTRKEAYSLWIRSKEQTFEGMSESELQFALELREIGSPTS